MRHSWFKILLPALILSGLWSNYVWAQAPTNSSSPTIVKVVCPINSAAIISHGHNAAVIAVETEADFDSTYSATPVGQSIIAERKLIAQAISDTLKVKTRMLILVAKNHPGSTNVFCISSPGKFFLEQSGRDIPAYGAVKGFCLIPGNIDFTFIVFPEMEIGEDDSFYFYINVTE